jgi:NADPH-dependent 2,4-dienoyl-CoA reductase/sulfur reductase-like enzyme/nitrite reductase/ring-hydroxylating ferredoxin subunit
VLLVRTGNGDYYALDLKCSHFGAKLNEGVLNGDKVACPWHDAHFDVKTGAVSSGPGLNALQSYPVRVVGDKVLVSVPATPAANKPKGACLDCDKRTFVIVGTGAAGAVAAEALRQEGFQGNIVMVTREDSLPYDRTGLSKWPDTPKEKMLLRGEDFYKAHDIQVQRGRNVQSIDTTTKTITFSDGQTMRYDSALLATGGRPRDIPVPGKDLDQVLFMRSLEDAQNISKLAKTAKKVVIIGSSFIGMELAAALKKNMKVEDVVVVGMEKVPFERVLGTEVGGVLQKMHEENGVKFRLGRTVKSFNGKGKVESVVLDNGETLPADFVVVGAGIIPNTDLVKGVPFEKDGSILVNSSMKTSADGLFAAGDVARFPYQGENIRVEHWNVAQNQGRAAARAMLGQKVNFNTVPFFWTRSFDVSLQYAGHASSFDDVIVKGDTSKRQFTAYYVRNDKVVAVAAMGRGTSAIAAGQLMSVGKMPSVADIRAGDPDLHAIVKGLNSGIET